MERLIKRFWLGEITLWRSYWLVGELLNALFILLISNFEIYVFGNNKFSNRIGGKIDVFEMDEWQSLQLDDIKQLQTMELLFKKKLKKYYV